MGYSIEEENKPIEEQLAGYFDKQGVWHQQGLTSEQLKAITGRKKELDEEERHSDLRLLLIKEKRDTPYNCMRYLFLSGKAHL